MTSQRPGKRTRLSGFFTPTRIGVAVTILFVIGYGFYIEAQDFHPKGGFQQHRKFLLDNTEENSKAEQGATVEEHPSIKENVQRESEQLQSASQQEARKQNDSQASRDGEESQVKNVERNSVEGSIDGTHASKQGSLPADNAVRRDVQEGGEQLASTSITEEVEAKAEAQVATTSVSHAETGQQTAAGIPSSAKTNLPGAHRLTNVLVSDLQKGLTGFTLLTPFDPNHTTSGTVLDLSGNRSAQNQPKTSEEEWLRRQAAVRIAAKDSWDVYEKYAMGEDELAPLTLKGKSSVSFGGMAATLIDSLDTLWLLDMKEEFGRARNWIQDNLRFDKRSRLSLFETVIRIIGGLLSAYDLSGDKLFLDKSQELVDKLMPCLNTTQTGIPTNLVQFNAAEGEYRKSDIGRAALAEFGSIQVEFLALSHRTSNATYGEKAESIIKILHENYPDKGLLPVWFNRKQARFTGSQLYTVGAMADSYFEYLLKLWLLHQKQVEMYRSMWEAAIDEILQQLVVVNSNGVTLIGQRRNRGMFSAKFEHLACYLPGNMALGVAEGAVDSKKGAYYLDIAANLTTTCFQLYNSTATGLGLDVVMFTDKGGMNAKIQKNMLRPETVESFFYMWRVTRDPKYREWGWTIFEAFQKYSKTPEGAFASVKDVNVIPVELEDSMESFWLAETLKYLWLLFGPDSNLPFSEWVLNTEAHPLRIALPKQ